MTEKAGASGWLVTLLLLLFGLVLEGDIQKFTTNTTEDINTSVNQRIDKDILPLLTVCAQDTTEERTQAQQQAEQDAYNEGYITGLNQGIDNASISTLSDALEGKLYVYAWERPTDGMMAWYTEANKQLNEIECAVYPDDCN